MARKKRQRKGRTSEQSAYRRGLHAGEKCSQTKPLPDQRRVWNPKGGRIVQGNTASYLSVSGLKRSFIAP